MGSHANCLVLADSEAVARVAAETVVQAIRMAVFKRDTATMALSGGGTPRPVYELLAESAYDRVVPWERLHLLWGDERLVPPDHEASNYRMAEETGLLDRPLAGIHRMPGELSADEAAARYGETLARVCPGSPPVLDLALQGMGDDGHTASLFPGSRSLAERDRYVIATEEHAGYRRLTLTLPVLEASRRVLFVVVGEGKREALHRVLKGGDPELPSTMVTKGAGRVTWLVDRNAAGRMPAGRDSDGNEPSRPPAC